MVAPSPNFFFYFLFLFFIKILVYIEVLILTILFYKITFFSLDNIIVSFMSNAIVTNFSVIFLLTVEVANSYLFAF